MAYVAVKGGERRSQRPRLARRGTPRRSRHPDLAVAQIREQLGPGDRPGHGGGIAVRSRARGAGDQAGAGRSDRGRVSAARLPHHPAALRSYAPVDTASMRAARRISAIFKDLPGGQTLGPTYDYTHRLLDFRTARGQPAPDAPPAPRPICRAMPRVPDILGTRGTAGTRQTGPDRMRTGRPDARAIDISRRSRCPAAGPGARRRGLPPGDRLLHPARLRRQHILSPARSASARSSIEIEPAELGFASISAT